MFKLNDQKTKLTLRSAYFFRQDDIWIVRLMNLNDKSVKIAGKTYNRVLLQLFVNFHCTIVIFIPESVIRIKHKEYYNNFISIPYISFMFIPEWVKKWYFLRGSEWIDSKGRQNKTKTNKQTKQNKTKQSKTFLTTGYRFKLYFKKMAINILQSSNELCYL